jgi:hypothetical protein
MVIYGDAVPVRSRQLFKISLKKLKVFGWPGWGRATAAG